MIRNCKHLTTGRILPFTVEKIEGKYPNYVSSQFLIIQKLTLTSLISSIIFIYTEVFGKRIFQTEKNRGPNKNLQNLSDEYIVMVL